MSKSASKEKTAAAIGGASRWTRRAILGVICALVIGVYAWSACSGIFELLGSGAHDSYYNLLVQGFRDGHLYVNREAPPDLGQYVNNENWLENHRLHDLSYYQGRLYLYFGVTPALVLFWPCVALTGHYLLHKDAAVIFFSAGFLAAAGLLWAVWRRYFKESGVGVVAAGTLALGLANFAPAILGRCDVYEVAISCGYALTMLALLGIWCAMHDERREWRWLAAASLAYGLAVGARPSLLLGGIILLAPVVQAWRAKRRLWPLLVAAVGPMVLMGVGLMSYNLLRFHNPLEFGQRYQLPMTVHQQFSPRYLWFNFRVGFLELARWSGSFPFVQDIAMPAKPMGYWQVDHAFGVLTNSPLAWLALAVPLAWRKQPAEARSNLCCFFWAVALLIGICALTLGLHDSMCLRYEVEFAAPLVFLAAVGVLALERALAGRPAWRRAARCGWGLLLAFSVAFNIFASFEMQAHYHSDFGITLVRAGRVDEAIIQYQKTLQIKPDEAEAHYRLGAALLQKGKLDEAIPHLQKALDVNPNFTEAHINFGTALLQKGRLDEAIAHFQKALQINPDIAQAHNNLGNAFLQKGRVDEAITHFQKALEIEPGAAVARYSLGVALVRNGRLEEAITQYQKALQLTPSDPTIQNSLAWLLATCPQSSLRNGGRAVELARQANGLTGGENPVVLRTLAAACAEAGRYSEAVETAQHALRLAQAQSNTALAGALESELKLYQAGSPFHSSEQPQ